MPTYRVNDECISVVRNHGVIRYFQFSVDMFFVFVWYVYDWKKTTVLFICIHKRSKSIVFAEFIKFCDESGLAILIKSGLPWLLEFSDVNVQCAARGVAGFECCVRMLEKRPRPPRWGYIYIATVVLGQIVENPAFDMMTLRQGQIVQNPPL